MKILYITRKNLIPANSGDTIISFEMLKKISNDSNKIDLVNFIETHRYSNDEKNILLKYCNNIYEVNKFSKKKLKYYIYTTLFTCKSFSLYQMYSEKMQNKIIELVQNNDYDLIYFDHLHMGQYITKLIRILNEKNVTSIINEHNVEYSIWKRKFQQEKNFLFKIFLKIHMKRLKKEEYTICSLADKVYAISYPDKQLLKKMGLKNIYVKTPLTNFEIVKTDMELENFKYNIMFMGSMDWHPNIQAVTWFVEKVFPKISKRYTLYIVGKNPAEEILRLKSDRIIVTGIVDTVDKYIKKCDVNIIPMLTGGGVKIKLLEAMAKGIPTITTTFGAKGIDVYNDKEILIADNDQEFISSLNKLEQSIELRKKLRENGREFYDKNNVMDNEINEQFGI